MNHDTSYMNTNYARDKSLESYQIEEKEKITAKEVKLWNNPIGRGEGLPLPKQKLGGKMKPINTIATAVTKINQHKVDDAICRFIGRHWKGFLMGFFTLAIWNIIMKWVTV